MRFFYEDGDGNIKQKLYDTWVDVKQIDPYRKTYTYKYKSKRGMSYKRDSFIYDCF